VVARALPFVVALVLSSAPLHAAGGDAKADDAKAGPNADAVDLTGDAPPVTPEEEPEEEGSWLTAPSERRCGFSFGLAGGGMLGNAVGYPDDALKIGRDAYETDTGVAGGGGGVLWVGIAVTDWLAFGVGFGGGQLFSSEHRTGFGGLVFHLEAFPAFGAGGAWRDLGLLFEAGVGGSTTTPAEDDENKVIDSGGASRLAFGVFYEGIRFWKFSTGPYAAYDMTWSQSAFQPAGMLGWRTAFYAGP
jgi:hypothetical protein